MRVRVHPKWVCYLIMGLFPLTSYSAEDMSFRDYKNPFSKSILNLPKIDPVPEIEIPMIDLTTDDANETDANETDVEIFDDSNETSSTPDENKTEVEVVDENKTEVEVVDENKTKFSHPRKNWRDILRVIPTFTESEEIPKNTESTPVPREREQKRKVDSNHTDQQPSYKVPTNKNIVDANVPIFDESEHIPPRDTSEVIPERPAHPPKNGWETAVGFDGGWKCVEWFGYYYQPPQTHLGHGWIFHAKLGWLFLASDGFDSVWMWNSNLEQWMWTNKDVFGCLYGNKTSQWVCYNPDKNIFYDYVREKWMDIKNL